MLPNVIYFNLGTAAKTKVKKKLFVFRKFLKIENVRFELNSATNTFLLYFQKIQVHFRPLFDQEWGPLANWPVRINISPNKYFLHNAWNLPRAQRMKLFSLLLKWLKIILDFSTKNILNISVWNYLTKFVKITPS